MKTVICTSYGPPEVLQVREVNKPVPGDNDVLIKIYASTVTMGDCELRNLTLPLWTRLPIRLYMGYRKPRRLTPGMEFSGVIESVGKTVKSFKKGDPVFGSCGMLNALHFLRKAKIQSGQKILIIGAGGSIGSYGVQLAKLYGAEVTAVDSTGKLDMLRAIGADHVIDYTQEDFYQNGKKYDVIFDTVYKSSFSRCIDSLKPEGLYLMANPGPFRMIRALWVSWISRKKVIFAFAREKVEDLKHLGDLIVSCKIKPSIDRRYPLEKTAEAHAYVEKGFKKGCVVITVMDSDQ